MGEAALSTMSATSRNGWRAVYATCPHWDVQHFLLENITEEEGFVGSGDFAPVRHSELLLDFAETCGMKRDEILNAQVNGELLPETLGLQSWCAVQSQQALRRGAVGPADRAGEPGAAHLQQDHAAAAREVRLRRGRGHLLHPPHRGRRRAWREGLRDRREVRHHRRAARRLRAPGQGGDDDAPALSRRRLSHVRGRRPRARSSRPDPDPATCTPTRP